MKQGVIKLIDEYNKTLHSAYYSGLYERESILRIWREMYKKVFSGMAIQISPKTDTRQTVVDAQVSVAATKEVRIKDVLMSMEIKL